MRGDEEGEGGEKYCFQNLDTIKVYESLSVNPGELARLWGAARLDRNPVENHGF